VIEQRIEEVIERLVTLDARQGSGLFVEYRVCASLWTHPLHATLRT
jgi:hypothetical protein